MKNILRLSRILLKPYKFRIILIIFFALLVSNSPYVFSLLGRWLVDDVLMKPAVTAPVDDSSPVSNTGEDPDQPALTAVENTNYEEADAAAEDNASPAVEDKASPAIVPEKPSGGILRNLSLPEEPERALLLFFMVSVGIHLAITLMSLMSEFSTSHIVQAGTHDLRGELNEKFNTSDMVFFNREQVGQMMTRIMDDTGAVPGNLLNFVVNTITHIGTLIIGILLLLRLNPLMGLVVLGLVPFYAGACLLLLPRIKSNTELTREKWSQLIGHAVERLQNIITVKNYAQEERESTQFKERVSVSLGLNRQNIKLNLIFGILTAAVSAIGTTAVLAYGFLLIKSGKMRLGEVLAFYQVTAQLFVPLSALAGMTTVVQTLRIYAERIFGVLNSSDSIPEPDSQQADITAFIFKS